MMVSKNDLALNLFYPVVIAASSTLLGHSVNRTIEGRTLTTLFEDISTGATIEFIGASAFYGFDRQKPLSKLAVSVTFLACALLTFIHSPLTAVPSDKLIIMAMITTGFGMAILKVSKCVEDSSDKRL